MKQVIRLTESDLHRMIKESVKEVLNEIGDTEKGQYMLGRLQARQQARHGHETGENNGYGYIEGGSGKNDYTSRYAHDKKHGAENFQKGVRMGNAHAHGFHSEYNKERKRLGYND